MRLGTLKSKRRYVRQKVRELKPKIARSVLGYTNKPLIVDLGTYSFTTTVYLKPHDSGIGWVKGEQLYECKIMVVAGKRVAPKAINDAAQRLRDEGWGTDVGLLRSKEGFIVTLSPKQAVRVWRVWGDKVLEVSADLAGEAELRALQTAVERIEGLLEDPSYFGVDLTDLTLAPAVIEHYLRGCMP
jgi:hypothetical protein